MKMKSYISAMLLALCSWNATAQVFTQDPAYGASIPLDGCTLRLLPVADNAVRVKVVPSGVEPLEELVYTAQTEAPRWKTESQGSRITLILPRLTVSYDRQHDGLTFLDARGRVLLRELPGGRRMKPVRVGNIPSVEVGQTFLSPQDEYIFGTGQFQDGYLNIRGLTRRLTQVNTQISIPFILSNKGYGLMWNNYGLTNFNPSAGACQLQPLEGEGETYSVQATSTQGTVSEQRTSDTFTCSLTVSQSGLYALLLDCGQKMSRRQYLEIDGRVLADQQNIWLPPTTSVVADLSEGTHRIIVKGVRGDQPTLGWRRVDGTTEWHSPVAQGIDYTVFAGTPDEVTASCRALVGPSPLMPDWMLGYVHCRERYGSQEELLQNARGFQERNIPLSVIVQDWLYWGKHGWNAMRFDEDNYPDPKAMTDELHRRNLRLMLSVWSKIDRNNDLGKEFERLGYYIPGTDWVDFFNPQAASAYWTHFRDGLLRPYHIDSWWLDATEPENDDLQNHLVANGQVPGELYRNVYPLKVVSTVFNGLQEEEPDRVPVILTRSAFPGMQRYNAVVWSGDVNCDLETLRRQIVGGLGYAASGMPWWTMDAGGFFRRSDQYTSARYQQWMLRWIECSVFLPVMRVHGYQSQTEPWHYPAETEQIFADCIRERYELMPYLQECARRVAEEGYTIMRPLIFDFSDDPEALSQQTEYMFGPRYLVCPVIEEDAREQRVYLPRNARGWTHRYTRKHYAGGQYVSVPLSLEHIPVFERE